MLNGTEDEEKIKQKGSFRVRGGEAFRIMSNPLSLAGGTGKEWNEGSRVKGS